MSGRATELTRQATELTRRAADLVSGLGPGSTQSLTYPTAFLARLRRADGAPLFPAARDWLRRHQHPDGSWGGTVALAPDRLVSTLAALLAIDGSREEWVRPAVDAATAYLWRHGGRWRDSPYETIAFELAVPHLVGEARERGLSLPYPEFGALERLRAEKLSRVPAAALTSVPTTLLYSLEVLGDLLDPRLATAFRSANGSLGNSPSATGAYWAATGDPAALDYLRRLVTARTDGGFPEVHPIATFETAWVLYLLHRAGLLGRSDLPHRRDLPHRVGPRPETVDGHLRRLRQALGDAGVAAIDPSFPVPDSDDSAMVHNVLHDTGYDVRTALDGLLVFEAETGFTTFPYERGASVSANARVLEALAHRPERFAGQLGKILGYLRDERHEGGWWRDKWHMSAYYATAQVAFALDAVLAGAAPPGARGLAPGDLAGTWRWLLESQHVDGSWGADGGTAEETAYAVLALDALARHVPGSVPAFAAAGTYLDGHLDDDFFPELWIGKGLYTPDVVVRASVLAARAVTLRRVPAGQVVRVAE